MKSHCHFFFETLGTKVKQDILFTLKERPLCVNELAQRINQERSKTSHALQSLLRCGFVEARKADKRRIYSLNNETVLPLLILAEQHIRKHCRRCRK